ncbi:MAG TPA: NAD(P) transhydrogenase subunit alpha [Pirellulaceae bacterium]|nr:NAD(P) transhydrogenase subunit alpha [Pirellulaceae bacterium]
MSPSPSTFKVFGLILAAMLIGGLLFAQVEAPGDAELSRPSDQNVANEAPEAAPVDEAQPLPAPAELSANDDTANANWRRVIASLTVFVLAVFVGFEVITKVPPTLHTPLMSGANAISGITLVGAVIVAASMSFSGFVGFLAVTLATVNAVGGFMVTHRMLAMFKKR